MLLNAKRWEAPQVKRFTPQEVLFYWDNGNPITVMRMLEAINYVLNYIIRQSPMARKYVMARKVLFAARHLLNNEQYENPSKEALRALADVLKDMNNERARSDHERMQNELNANIVKRWIDELHW
ncbi:hypothetical protein [Adlercreutzia sp. ZJ473]|uniref:hypothetical protein n=1 Tax=Adlercreutzia sp. ZJ473 TaxID=2722822 RepID=UPI0015520793|nr:hypothetical protein [Adlercreutzia sp. ZJ473]